MGQQVSTSAEGCHPIRPSFPSLYWPAESCEHAIYYLWDSWRFTLLWTLILYAIFHMGSAAIALGVQVGKHRSTWKYLWAVPAIYAITAALEAVVAGSIVGVLAGQRMRHGGWNDAPQQSRRITCHNAVGRDILGHNASSTNHYPLTNGHTGKNDAIATEPAVFPDCDWLASLGSFGAVPYRWIYWMRTGIEGTVWADERPGPNTYQARINPGAVAINVYIIPKPTM
ncbi:hypothetical protein SCARD494_04655 [Seiridium cardinale]